MANFHNTGDYQTKQSLETFSFLPPMTQEEIYEQIAYVLAQGWTPAIEHEHPGAAFNHYWTMWKLPFFGEQDLGHVVEELEACRRAHPSHLVRLVGYDNYTQCMGSAFVVYEGRG
ncbi:MAG: ribulose bisphosphate carboxylase small subunit [Thiogranum sp.]|nr:ribulose bisphosphate carboxylase small subunit [Thiogranum sp.]